jgi:hypothetical protein
MNKRQEEILIKLNKLGFLSRQQISQIFNLGSKRNTNRVLKSIESYLSSFREGYDTVYYLNKKGREWVGSEIIRKKTIQTKHFLLRNQYFIFQGCPNDWRVEIKVSDGGKNVVISDVVFNKGGKFNFVEIDCTQSMSENVKKINKYKKIYDSKTYQKQFGYFPTLHWLTESPYRKEKIMTFCNGLPYQCWTVGEIK